MCGICGKIRFDGRGIERSLVERMCRVVAHRGPDDSGIYIEAKETTSVGLGHQRLSIIDLSKAGHQPMCNETRTIWIVFNGEIYNFRELRAGLEKQGHRFLSNTDTEVLIHLYEEEGIDAVRLLNGMFAFGLWMVRKAVFFFAGIGSESSRWCTRNGQARWPLRRRSRVCYAIRK